MGGVVYLKGYWLYKGSPFDLVSSVSVIFLPSPGVVHKACDGFSKVVFVEGVPAQLQGPALSLSPGHVSLLTGGGDQLMGRGVASGLLAPEVTQ